MPFQTELQDLVKQVNPELNFYSSLMNVNRDSIKPIFLYHVPKTGGLSFQTAIEWARLNLITALKLKGIDNPLPLVARTANPNELKNLNHNFFYLLSTHLPYGSHFLPKTSDFELMCIFRDPIDRISSAFSYQCMRQNIIPTQKNFIKFFRNPENINRFCKQLHPNAINEEVEDSKAVIKNLDENFSTVVTLDTLHDAIEYYLSLFNLPNVLQKRTNRTLKQFKIDTTQFTDEINELNEEDLLLYQDVKSNSKIPELKDQESNAINNITSIIFEQQSTKKVATRGIPIETKGFQKKMQKIVNNSLTPFDLMLMNFPQIIGEQEGINK
ncbi:sulfotransferase family 2 domain-containing protein [Psychrosphaera sp. B3R10]|uniref:sulfotransferase family 2 domain-containing protein n=1 Tax=unclassified Psychrosphaera TaxID=2641570 RepID=UPI001C08E625|nr:MULTISPECIES: sulfotransferase family 2 domain-containing protein [unclassified Psychrosphaera]MBU2884050.1 sulfotransferase family 2 domain-containing protein [Psychrosphaera sp. I2R16]MBU2988180.1 sulfotransferase family 2 domain-containing protein [Psychrosphaera sp. B3R10]